MWVSRAFYRRFYNIALIVILVQIHKVSIKCKIALYWEALGRGFTVAGYGDPYLY